MRLFILTKLHHLKLLKVFEVKNMTSQPAVSQIEAALVLVNAALTIAADDSTVDFLRFCTIAQHNLKNALDYAHIGHNARKALLKAKHDWLPEEDLEAIIDYGMTDNDIDILKNRLDKRNERNS